MRGFVGLCMIVVGIAWIWWRQVPIGLEGRPPFYTVRGRWAKALGVAAIGLGIFLAFFAA